ncbi:MAG: diaminopimelate decarboxylase [Thermoplasmata archaeon]
MKYYADFENKGGNLYSGEVDLVDLARREGTPLLVTSERRLVDNYNSIYESFSKRYKKFKINYAVKANSNPTILSIFRRMGSGADTASMGEIYIARFSGFGSDDIIFTPNFAPRETLLEAYRMGIRINFDDIGQFQFIADIKPRHASFRINPGMGGGEFPGIVTGGHDTKFGIPEEHALRAYKLARKYGAGEFGIHMHGGSNNLSEEYFRLITQKFFGIARRIMDELNIEFSFIDIGGGFGVPYREEEKPLDMERVADYVTENLKNIIGSEEPMLMVEPGRYLVADSTVLLGRVNYIKNYGKKIVGTDIGMNILLRPALYGAYHRIVVANRLDSPPADTVRVVGQICENTDRIGDEIKMQEASEGDIIAVFNAGAYVYSMSSNYNGFPRPEEVLITGDGDVIIIRERERYHDLISGATLNRYMF